MANKSGKIPQGHLAILSLWTSTTWNTWSKCLQQCAAGAPDLRIGQPASLCLPDLQKLVQNYVMLSKEKDSTKPKVANESTWKSKSSENIQVTSRAQPESEYLLQQVQSLRADSTLSTDPVPTCSIYNISNIHINIHSNTVGRKKFTNNANYRPANRGQRNRSVGVVHADNIHWHNVHTNKSACIVILWLHSLFVHRTLFQSSELQTLFVHTSTVISIGSDECAGKCEYWKCTSILACTIYHLYISVFLHVTVLLCVLSCLYLRKPTRDEFVNR